MPSFLSTHDTFFLSYLPPLLFTLKKQRREVSINRPASYEPAALPLRHPAFYHLPTYPLPFPFLFFYIQKKLHRRESNPGRKRERLACYQLHHNGLLIICTTYVQFFATFLPSSPLSSYIISRFHGVVGYHITFT